MSSTDQSMSDDAFDLPEDDAIAPVSSFDEVEGDGVNDAIPQPGYYGFSIRELAIIAIGLLVGVCSFLTAGAFADFGFTWLLTGGFVLAAAALIVVRRIAPQSIERVGSLGIDQFASVAFGVAVVAWLGQVVSSFGAESGKTAAWLGLVGALIGAAATIGANHLPVFRDDFIGRQDALASVVAAPARPIVPTPKVERKVAVEPDEAPADADDELDELEVADEVIFVDEIEPVDEVAVSADDANEAFDVLEDALPPAPPADKE